ncbi:hypothetical protein ABEY61_29420 [Bacillus toyonensis]
MFNKNKVQGILIAAGVFATSISLPSSSYAAMPVDKKLLKIKFNLSL